jgi:hypothetical protein
MDAGNFEKRLGSLLGEVRGLMGRETIDSVIEGAAKGAAKTRASVDRNLDTLLSMANLPSRSDYRKLQNKLDTVQGSLRNLNRKLDDLSKSLAASGGSAKAPAKPASKAKKGAAKRPSKARTRKSQGS